jgi:hypothetical protein
MNNGYYFAPTLIGFRHPRFNLVSVVAAHSEMKFSVMCEFEMSKNTSGKSVSMKSSEWCSSQAYQKMNECKTIETLSIVSVV